MDVDPPIHADLEWAFEEAVRTWECDGGGRSGWILHATSDSEHDVLAFQRFLAAWGVARCLTKASKVAVFAEYIANWRDAWVAARSVRASFTSVPAFARLLRERAWSTPGITATSLSSKLAYISNPAVFAPYDGFARKGLVLRGFSVEDHDYVAYMAAFGEVRKYLIPIAQASRSRRRKKSISLLASSVFAMRLTDMLLMREGGYRVSDS